MRRILLSLSAVLMFMAPTLGAPAQASLPAPGGGDCAVTYNFSRPSAGYLRLTWTTKCNNGVFAIEHGMTLQRSGKTVTHSDACRSSAGTLKTCTKSITIADPSGGQAYQGYDELYIDSTCCSAFDATRRGLYEAKGTY